MNIVIDEETIRGYATGLRLALSELATAQKTIKEVGKLAMDRELLSLEQACAYLNVGEKSILYYRTALNLPHYKKGKDGIWFLKADIDAWLESGKINRHSK